MFFFSIAAWIAEVAGIIRNGAKAFFPKRIATFVNGPASLLNNDSKNPADWKIERYRKVNLEKYQNNDALNKK